MTDRAPFILGIESSCDETACALVDRHGRVRVNAIASQVDLHARFGGVVPEVAARMHIQSCLPMVKEALIEAGVGWDAIEAIAVTKGPGLIGCLLVGLETAKTLAWQQRKPLIAVNHLEGHLYSVFVNPAAGTNLLIENGESLPYLPAEPLEDHAIDDSQRQALRIARPEYPHIGLIISGGHSSLVWIEGPDRLETIAQTRDDAVGEAYDKVARMAGLGYPGGPVIDRMAAEGTPGRFSLTPPMMRRDKPDFSFSGLKTQVSRIIADLSNQYGTTLPEDVMKDLCAGFQQAALESLLGKSLDALQARGVRDLAITGGVACNRGLRRRAAELGRTKIKGLRVWFPHPSLCTDNAAMIAGLAWHLDPLGHTEALRLNAQATLPL